MTKGGKEKSLFTGYDQVGGAGDTAADTGPLRP